MADVAAAGSHWPTSRLSCFTAAIATILSLTGVAAQEVTQPNPCLRWGAMTTVARGQNADAQHALWIYGGRARTSIGQAADTWTNALLKLDLSQPWDVGTSPVSLVRADSNSSTSPPQTALGMMWTNANSSQLYTAFGEYSDTPPARPSANNVWVYDIPSNKWGIVASSASVNAAAEGAMAVVPGAGSSVSQKAFYFGGHVDEWTQANYHGGRVYLSSMASFDVGANAWSNMTKFATNGQSGSRNTTVSQSPPILRAGSTLTYVPNLGTDNKGVLVSIGGGNLEQVLDNSVLDVYDIGAGAFVKQATQGSIMTPRLSHCAVRGSAIVNGQEQHQIFVYGGQAANRSTQLAEGPSSDLYVLTLPSYTWSFVGSNITGSPTGRAGHTCELLGDQLISVGGYISESILCEIPAIYVLNTTSLTWATSYTPNTRYSIPTMLYSVTGGGGTSNSTGSSGWQGPNNQYTAATATATSTNGPGPTSTDGARLQQGDSKSRVGAIIGGVVGGVCLLFLVALLVHFFAKRQRKRETSKWAGRALRTAGFTRTGRNINGDGDSLYGVAYEDTVGEEPLMGQVPMRPLPARTTSHRPTDSWDSQNSLDSPAFSYSDNVEADTAGMRVMGGSHLVPRETLRVANPSDNISLNYSNTRSTTNTRYARD